MPNDLICCSFCYKIAAPEQFVITGPDAIMICDQCIDICTKLLSEFRAYRVEDQRKNRKSEKDG